MKVRIWVVQGKLAKAQEWAHEKGLSPDDDLSYLCEFEHITLARVLIARYKSDRLDDFIREALELLERLLKAAEEGGRLSSVIEILILQALANEAQGNLPPALVSLEHALTLAEPEGYIRIFMDEGEAMRSLIEKLSRNRDHPLSCYMDKLLAAIAQPMPSPQSTLSNEKTKIRNLRSALVEPLSESEIEVLRLLRTELNGPEIARERMVSLTTIRTHTQHIYAKLGVNNRQAAVRRAEELGLL